MFQSIVDDIVNVRLCYTGQWSSASSNSWTPRTVALSWGTWSAQVSLIEDNAIIPELTKI